MRILSIILISVFCIFFSDSAFAINPDRYEVFANFQTELDRVITGILTDDDSLVAQLNEVIFRALYFALLFFAITRFIVNGFSEEFINYLLAGFVLSILTETYLIWTNGIFAFFELSGLAIQEFAVGTDSKYFLSTYVFALFDRIEYIPLSLFDAIELVVILFISMVVNLILQVVIAVAETYAIFGFAVMQIIGPVFLVFWIHPKTRPLFDKWFGLLLSMAIYAFLVRVVGSVYGLFTMAMVGSFTAHETLSEPMLVDPHVDGALVVMLILHSVIGIVTLLGIGKLAGSLTQGVGTGTISNMASKGAMQLAGRFFGK